MRKTLMIFPLLLFPGQALAQSTGPTTADTAQIERVLNDPAMADRLANVMQVMSKSFLELPAGEMQAALEGRKPTAAEKRMTVRDMARKNDPNFDRNFQRQMAQAGPMMRQSMKSLSVALPQMMQGLQQAGKALERAVANMPDPTYPKR